MSTYLVAGLGNIGDEYAHTRHNIGFDVVDHFTALHGGAFQTGRLASVSRVRIKGRTVVCIKPTTYMNLSGRAVRYWLDQEKVPLDRLLVVLDELALPLSRLRLKMQGSDGGHNGLKSIEETLGTRDYPRLRFGIGNDYPKGRQVEYVLGRWRDSETGLVRLKIGKCAELIESFVLAGPEATMTAFNNLNLAL